MTDFKLVISDPKSGKTLQREVKENQGSFFLNKKLGEKVNGDDFGLTGYEFQIAGGSDYCGFPMKKGIPGIKRKRILTGKAVGFRGLAKGRTKKKKKQRPKRKGLRRRKTVCGEVIHEQISQINLKILKVGKESLFAEAVKEEAPKAEGKVEKKEAPKVEAKTEEKPVEKKEAAPKVDKK